MKWPDGGKDPGRISVSRDTYKFDAYNGKTGEYMWRTKRSYPGGATIEIAVETSLRTTARSHGLGRGSPLVSSTVTVRAATFPFKIIKPTCQVWLFVE